MKKLVFISILFILCISIVHTKTIWQNRNIYSSTGNIRVGDIIIVRVADVADLSFEVRLNNDNSYSITSNPDSTVTKFLPKISSDRKLKNNRRSQFSSKRKIQFNIASRIVRRVGRAYQIQGFRNYTFDGSLNRVTVTGLIDPSLIKGRMIESGNVADFSLTITGQRLGVNIQRQPLKKDEKAEVKLTEQEKQRIIIDYLQKMLRELTQ